MPTVGSMFSGGGLLDLGLDRAGLEVIWQAECDRQASKVLARHWPQVLNLGDVTVIDWSQVEVPDVLCGGGWPCTPFSSAGRQLGEADPRYMWPEVARALRDLRPRHFVMEQSASLLARRFRPVWIRVLGDLADLGFNAQWAVLRASDVGAPHQRRRLFLVADADGDRLQRWQEQDGSEVGSEQPTSRRGDVDGCGPSSPYACGAPGRLPMLVGATGRWTLRGAPTGRDPSGTEVG